MANEGPMGGGRRGNEAVGLGPFKFHLRCFDFMVLARQEISYRMLTVMLCTGLKV